LGRRIVDEGLSIGGVPTSHQSMLLAVKHRVPLSEAVLCCSRCFKTGAAFESARTSRSVARCMSTRSERGQSNGGHCKTSAI
jgi:hypothetical protein